MLQQTKRFTSLIVEFILSRFLAIKMNATLVFLVTKISEVLLRAVHMLRNKIVYLLCFTECFFKICCSNLQNETVIKKNRKEVIPNQFGAFN